MSTNEIVDRLAREQGQALDAAGALRGDDAIAYAGGALGMCDWCPNEATILIVRPHGEDDEIYCDGCAWKERGI